MPKYTVKNKEELTEKSARKIDIEIGLEEIKIHRVKSIKKLSDKADIPGFRKGHVPEKIIVEKMGEISILEEAVNSWLDESIGEILDKEAPEAISLPQISTKKITPGNPIEISPFVPIRPKIILPDYVKIASEKNKLTKKPVAIEEKDIDDAVQKLREYVAKAINPENKNPDKNELPPVDDKFAEAIGGGKTVSELRERIKKDLESENIRKEKEKIRLEIIESIIGNTKGVIPDVLIDYEIEKMESEFENDIKMMGLSFEDYLKNAKKTREELKKDWRKPAEKRAMFNLIISEIKKDKKLEADKESVERETAHFLEHHKDADPERVRNSMIKMLSNEKVFEFLENQNNNNLAKEVK